MDLTRIDEFAKEVIFEAGRRIREVVKDDLVIETKSSANDFVTNMDRETELFIIESIKAFDPTHKIVGEEGMGDRFESFEGPVWIVDPIDGTLNFIKQHRHFMIAIGFFVDGVGKLGYIYDVMKQDLYHAIQGVGCWYNETPMRKLEPLTIEEAVIGINASWVIPNSKMNHEKIVDLVRTVRATRSYGSAAMEIAFIVSGKLDAYMSMRLSPWDIGGGSIIANEVGAVMSNLKGEPINLYSSDSFLIANPSIHQELLEKYIELK